MSLGFNLKHTPFSNPLIEAVNKAVDCGITVICAAGNSGPNEDTIDTPAVSEKVIAVGALEKK